MFDKVIRNGKVAVLYSPGFGAGWYSWASTTQCEDMLFCPELVAAVEAGDKAEQYLIAARNWPDAYDGGLPLAIAWVDVGCVFEIHEYDGAESVRVLDLKHWIKA